MPSLFKLIFIAAAAICGFSLSPSAKPNILVFLVDDFGPRDLSGYGSGFYETPAMDGLAAKGQRYTQAYSAHPRCVPSRYGFFTGRFPVRDGCPGERYEIDTETVTIAEALKAGGYTTFFAGKWHLGKTPDQMPEAQGFDINIAGGSAGAPGSYFAPYARSKNPHHKSKPFVGLDDAPEGEFLTERLTDETVDFLNSYIASKKEAPFFAVLAHYSVHTPIEAKPDDITLFEEKRGPKGKEQFMERDGTTKLEQDDATYAAMIKSVDDSLSRVLETLETLGLTDDTLIILTSDHGGLSNRGTNNKRRLATSNLPFRAGKGHLYEGGIRVPFIVRWPGITPEGQVNESIVTGTDLFATLLDAAGLDPMPTHAKDSVSILPAIKGETLQRGPIIWHSPRPRPTSTGDQAASAMRDGDHKILKFYYPEVHYQLYDLTTDPEEQNDLVHAKPALAAELEAKLEASLTDIGAIQTEPGK